MTISTAGPITSHPVRLSQPRLRKQSVDERIVAPQDVPQPSLVQLFDALLPGGKGLAVMLRAYFDESGTHGADSPLWVAGYLFESERYANLEWEWEAALSGAGLSAFHAVDC